jgi:SagB-type dehydrogenase family enzyme
LRNEKMKASQVANQRPEEDSVLELANAGIPAVPRLRDGAVVVSGDSDTVLISGLRTKVIHSATAGKAIIDMVPLMDGTRTAQDIASACHIALQQTAAVVDLLHQSGALEDAGRALHMPGQDRHAAAFASQYLNYTRSHAHSSQVMRDIAGAHVLVLGGSELAQVVASELGAAGIGEVTASDSTGIRCEVLACPAHAMVVYVDDGTDSAARDAAERSMQRGLSVLRVAARSGSVEIGPLFIKDLTACLGCFEASYRDVAQPTGGGGMRPSEASLAAGLIVNEALAVAGSLIVPMSYRRMVRLSPDLQSEILILVPEPTCALCGQSSARGSKGSLERARQYEWAVELCPEMPSCLAVGVASVVDHPSAAVVLQTTRREYQTCPSVALPAAGAATSSRVAESQTGYRLQDPGSLDETILSEILARVAGRKPGGDKPGDQNARWAPTGGNLGSVEIHVITPVAHALRLPGNIYKYDDMRHRLIAVRRDAAELNDVMDGTGLARDGVRALFVLSAAIGRVVKKYGSFGYRLVHLDAGCALTQLMAVTATRGHRMTLAEGWDDGKLTDILDLRPSSEIVTAVAGLYDGGPDAFCH